MICVAAGLNVWLFSAEAGGNTYWRSEMVSCHGYLQPYASHRFRQSPFPEFVKETEYSITYSHQSCLIFLEPIVNPGIHRESRNPSWIQESIVNSRIHRESRNPLWIQESTAAVGASVQHCTGMTKWPNTIQCLGSDDIMSLGIKSAAFLRDVHGKCLRQMFREKVERSEPITTPLDKVFERLGL